MSVRLSLLLIFIVTLAKEGQCFSPVRSHIHRRKYKIVSQPFSVDASLRSAYSTQLLVVGKSVPESSMYLVRVVFLRALAFVYGVAFMVAYRQNKALIGDSGITPARKILDQAEARGKEKRKQREAWTNSSAVMGKSNNPIRNLTAIQIIARVLNRNKRLQTMRELLWDRSDSADRPLTTILWLAKDRTNINPWLDKIALCGIGMATIVFVLGAANLPLLLGLWICQRSLWAVGGPWYGYGWESQLAELGFHSLFLAPLLSLNAFAQPEVSPIVTWSIRWYLFRIMMGAGLIKIKGGKEWKDLTAMYNHYETQPIPNPLSKYFHLAPKWWHRFEVIVNHFVELIAPWLVLLPFRQWRIAGGIIQIMFQAVLILSGNLSFLNWLTAVPALFCFDDAVIRPLFFPSRWIALGKISMDEFIGDSSSVVPISMIRRVVNILYGLTVARLSIPVVRNLCSRNQIMNGSFDPLRLVNTYGAFGTVNQERIELIVSSAMDPAGEWKEYEFRVKPGNVERSPRWLSPYHYRLDWQMWIAVQLGIFDRSPWMYTFLTKLFQCDEELLNTLMTNDPWDGQRPKYIRIDRYRYKFYRPDRGKKGPYWEREYTGRWYPRQGVCTLESLTSDQILAKSRR